MNLIIVDGMNSLYRFGHAYSELTTREGVSTGAVYGLLVCLLRLKRKYPDSRFAMVWDGPGRSWRYDLFPGYKAGREKTRDNTKRVCIFEQLPILKKVTALVGIPSIEIPEVEADDLIGILATWVIGSGKVPIIYSSDKDFIQLMPHGAKIIRDVNKKRPLEFETEESIKALFKVDVEVRDVLKLRAICGDSTDRIPGAMRMLGPVGALKLIRAGYDPSEEQAPMELNHKIVDVWADVHRNYKLMKVYRRRTQLTGSQNTKMKFPAFLLNIYEPVDKGNFRAFVGLLADLELEQAMEERITLWRLQDLTGYQTTKRTK